MIFKKMGQQYSVPLKDLYLFLYSVFMGPFPDLAISCFALQGAD